MGKMKEIAMSQELENNNVFNSEESSLPSGNETVAKQVDSLPENSQVVEENISTTKEELQKQANGVYDPTVTLKELEKQYILNALQHFGGNKSKAANALGITIKTLYNKLHRYGMMGKNQTEG